MCAANEFISLAKNSADSRKKILGFALAERTRRTSTKARVGSPSGILVAASSSSIGLNRMALLDIFDGAVVLPLGLEVVHELSDTRQRIFEAADENQTSNQSI